MRCRLTLDISWPALLWAAAGPPTTDSHVAAAHAGLRESFASETIVAALSVRTIFDAILAECALPQGSVVLMSGVNIQNMADIVAAHGLRIEAIDLDPRTLAPEPGALIKGHAATDAKICVVTQLFGSRNVFADAAELRRRGVLVIEDAAQAFDGSFHRGIADAAVSLFSFGPIKRCTALGGAVGIFRDANFAANVLRRIEWYPSMSEARFRRRSLKYLMLKMVSAPALYGLVWRAISAIGKDPDVVIGTAARGFSGKAILPAIRRRPPKRMIALMARQVAATPDSAVRQEICRDFFSALPESATPGLDASGNAYWLMPVRMQRRDYFIEQLRRAGFDATLGTTSLRVLEPERTARARDLMGDIVYVPNPAEFPERVRHRLKRAVVSALA
jgi:perosamine synthetase